MTQGRITSPFTATSTAAEVVAGIDLRDKRVIVTGGSSGIGVETARALASAGADVTLAVRNPDAGARVGAEINASLDCECITVARLDFLDLGSVRNFAQQWGSTPLHVLVNNADIMAAHWTVPLPDGVAVRHTTTHLGHFALATALHDALAAANKHGSSQSAPGPIPALRSTPTTSTSTAALRLWLLRVSEAGVGSSGGRAG